MAMLFIPIVGLIGCGDDSPNGNDKSNQEEPTPEEPNLPEEEKPIPGMSFTSLMFPNAGDSFSCNIYGLADGKWSVESTQPWCDVLVHGNVLKISVEPNDENDNRSGAIYILHSDGSLIGSILVRQGDIDTEAFDISTSSKNSFFPLFTATWCPFCPDMDRTLEEIQERWNDPILAMRIHVRGSELNNSISNELSEIYDNIAIPTGYFDNYFKVENKSVNVSFDYFWNLIKSNVNDSSYPANFSTIECKSIMAESTIDAAISITPAKSGLYRLLVFIVEDNIIKPQMTLKDGEISNYCHNGVLVGMMTPVSGQEMELNSSKKVFNLNSAIPSGTNINNLRLLVVLECNDSRLNYSDNCWYTDNCLSVSLSKTLGSGSIENLFIGEDIKN